ncbi:hypothetical protein V5096_13830 [Pseudoalteromonas carrageenovora]|uniref:hypothetical protein n=1 Tax=Pseudoalteromonas carrageenovora TaxID=227 RepID=UPI002FD49708
MKKELNGALLSPNITAMCGDFRSKYQTVKFTKKKKRIISPEICRKLQFLRLDGIKLRYNLKDYNVVVLGFIKSGKLSLRKNFYAEINNLLVGN